MVRLTIMGSSISKIFKGKKKQETQSSGSVLTFYGKPKSGVARKPSKQNLPGRKAFKKPNWA